MSRGPCSISAIMIMSTMLACSDSVAPPRAASITINSVADQEGFVGDFAPENPEILVLDSNGQPLAGVVVKFAVTAGGGSISNTTTVSGPQGRATAGAWTLGRSIGLNTVVGGVDGVGSLQFNATGAPIPSGTFQLVTVDGLSLPFADPLSITAVVSGTFTLSADKTYRVELLVHYSDDTLVPEVTSGAFTARWPKGLSFYFNGSPWVDGSLEGDTLNVRLWGNDDNLHSYGFVRG